MANTLPGERLKSFVSTQLLLTRMDDHDATAALEFLGTLNPHDAPLPLTEPAELVGV